jgi:hypothetical protein
MLLVDRRGAEKDQPVRSALIEKLDANGTAKVAWTKTTPGVWPGERPVALRDDLVKAGLFAAEANSALAIWKTGFFWHPGVTAIYILPQAEYDRLLPLTIKPAPPKLVRVGIVQQCGLEGQPAVAKRAAELIAKLDDASFQVREAASKELSALGPAVFPLLRKALADAGSQEVKLRIQEILDKLDASEWLEKGRRE